MRELLLCLLGASALAAARAWRAHRLMARFRGHLRGFAHQPTLGSYVEARPRVRLGEPQHAHAVLLLHGFSASPATFGPLLAALDEADAAYYAPRLAGFGLDDLRALRATRAQDWRREALEAYDLLAATAASVSVVGHSYGAVLACFIAQQRPVNGLVLISPFFFPRSALQRRGKRWLERTPRIARLLARLVDLVGKPIDPGRISGADVANTAAAPGVFHYETLPLASLLEVWGSAAAPEARSLQARRILVAYGCQELTVDLEALQGWMAQQPSAIDRLCYDRSAHLLLEDHDGLQAASDLAAYLLASA